MPVPVILAARRTPIGRFLGGLSRVPSPQLGAYAIEAVFEQVPSARTEVDEAILGCVLQAGVGMCPARQACLKAGLPDTVNAWTVNKVCGSSLQAVMLAAQSIRAGDNDLVLAGGFESMSRAPHMVYMRQGVKLGDATLEDHMMHDGLTCPFEKWGMGDAAEYIADKHEVSRSEQDRFSAQSHRRAALASESCFFEREMFPLDGSKLRQKFDVTKDEGIRPESTEETLAKLRPVFTKDGTVTAGNASQISDGASAVIVASAEKAEALGVQPLARIIDSYTSGVAPKDIFHAPAIGIKTLLDRNELGVADVDLYELNEAFAAQVLANIKRVGIPEDVLNVCGGGIALGHPIGASGARVLTTLLHQLVRTDGRRGVASLCLGGGNSVNMLVER